jgi:hypothetical protein
MNEITKAKYQAAKQTTQGSRTTKNEKQREKLRQKIQLPTGFLSTIEVQQALQRPKKAQQSSNPTQQSLKPSKQAKESGIRDCS